MNNPATSGIPSSTGGGFVLDNDDFFASLGGGSAGGAGRQPMATAPMGMGSANGRTKAVSNIP